MTTKYKMPKPHIHAELIKAWADDYNCIEIDYGRGWYSRYNPEIINLHFFNAVDVKFRIKPTSNYALAKIAELGGDDIVELYLYWLDGGELELFDEFSTESSWLQLDPPEDSPFAEFIHKLKVTEKPIRKKKRMVKQVLWVVTFEHPNIVKDYFFLDEGVEPSNFPEGFTAHKVPSCIREVEING